MPCSTPGYFKYSTRPFSLHVIQLKPVTASSDKRNLFGEAGLDADGNSRYFDSLLDFMLLVVPDPQGIHGLHMVEVVTSFSILRRNFRNVSATSLIPVLRSLPRLQEVRFEPWQQVDQAAQEDVDSGKQACSPSSPVAITDLRPQSCASTYIIARRARRPDTLLANHSETHQHFRAFWRLRPKRPVGHEDPVSFPRTRATAPQHTPPGPQCFVRGRR